MVLPKWLKYRYWRKRYTSWETVFQIIACVLGFVAIIGLIGVGIVGILALPISGGSSIVLPAWAITLLQVMYNTFLAVAILNAGRVIGITIDCIIDIFKQNKPNNEKLATAAATILGCILMIAISACICCVVPVPLASILELMLPWAIVGIGGMGAVGRAFGRTLGVHVRQKVTLLDYINSAIDYFKNGSFTKEEDKQFLENEKQTAINGMAGIKAYLDLPRDAETDRRKHLGFFPGTFDDETGLYRATLYLEMMKAAENELQQVIILYTLLGREQGPTLQKTVMEVMGYEHLIDVKVTLKDHIDKSIPDKIQRELLMENVVTKLGMFADVGRNYKNKQGIVKKDFQAINIFLHSYGKVKQEPEHENGHKDEFQNEQGPKRYSVV